MEYIVADNWEDYENEKASEEESDADENEWEYIWRFQRYLYYHLQLHSCPLSSDRSLLSQASCRIAEREVIFGPAVFKWSWICLEMPHSKRKGWYQDGVVDFEIHSIEVILLQALAKWTPKPSNNPKVVESNVHLA